MSGFVDGKGLKAVLAVKDVSRETQERLVIFHRLLKTWQARINLIAPSTIDQIWERHIADSMQVVAAMGYEKHVIDLGSGAGLPGMMMAFYMAETLDEDQPKRIDFIESAGKKCAFLRTVVRETGLQGNGFVVNIHHDRIENVIDDLPQPDVISARALASLTDLLRLSEHQIAQGAVGYFPKGREHRREISEARKDWDFEAEIIDSRFEPEAALVKITGLRRLSA